MRNWGWALACVPQLWAGSAWAQTGLGGAPQVAAQQPAAPPTDDEPVDTCKETWTSDRPRPKVAEQFPDRGTAGHVVELKLTIEHLPGEQVLPGGLSLDDDSPEASALSAAQFRLPKEASEVDPSIERQEADGEATTEVVLPLIPLPEEAGRRRLRLPPLPISIARASGRVQTLCTQPHEIRIEDPLANEPDAERRPDPPPRPQTEIWTAARDAVLGFLVALPVILGLLWAFAHFRKRWKKAPKPPPPVPAWQLALRQLDDLEREPLLSKEEYEEYLDRVADTLREYLGNRYGFEGLESTTREILRQLAERAPDFEDERQVRTLLQRTDLVKFARRMPSREECEQAMVEARRIIQRTTPRTSQGGGEANSAEASGGEQ